MDELSEDDKLTVARARKIMRFLSQPFQVAEVFTGKEGKLVDLQVRGCDLGEMGEMGERGDDVNGTRVSEILMSHPLAV